MTCKMENKVRGISDAIGRLALARTGSRFLVAGQTEADAEHRVPTGGKSGGGDAVLRVRQIERMELSPCVECLDLTLLLVVARLLPHNIYFII